MKSEDIKKNKKRKDILCCPNCLGGIEETEQQLLCSQCGQTFKIDSGIPLLFWENEWDSQKKDVTETIKTFYEKTPFPDYDDFDNVGSLIEKARKGLFAKLLDDQVPFGTDILECGCGTGQLSNFLSVANRNVIGTDICMNSLKMANEFKEKNSLNNVSFYQMNLFRPCFKPRSFDLVISIGVLHHTSDPFLAFRTISTLVKPKGYILIGLYHQYGRLLHDFRQFIFKLTGDKFKFLDSRNVDKKLSEAKRKSWFNDQYKNPHESKHTIGEVLKWLDKTGMTFVKSIPKSKLFEGFSPNEKLFRSEKTGSPPERFIKELGMTFTNSREGGFFLVIARKKE